MKRRKLLFGAVAVVVAVVVGLIVAGQLRHRPPTDCDTVRDLLVYNRQFADQTKTSARTDNAELSTIGQYQQWAARIEGYASQISDPALSARAKTAAELAAQTADLVPRYRAKPDDVEVSRQYARIGIEFGNAITTLDYACAPKAS